MTLSSFLTPQSLGLTVCAIVAIGALYAFVLRKPLAKRKAVSLLKQARAAAQAGTGAPQRNVRQMAEEIATLQIRFGLDDAAIGILYPWELNALATMHATPVGTDLPPRSEDVELEPTTLPSVPKARPHLALVEQTDAVRGPAMMVDDGWYMPRFAMDDDDPNSVRPLSLEGSEEGVLGTMPSIAPPARTGFENSDSERVAQEVRFVTVGNVLPALEHDAADDDYLSAIREYVDGAARQASSFPARAD